MASFGIMIGQTGKGGSGSRCGMRGTLLIPTFMQNHFSSI